MHIMENIFHYVKKNLSDHISQWKRYLCMNCKTVTARNYIPFPTQKLKSSVRDKKQEKNTPKP